MALSTRVNEWRPDIEAHASWPAAFRAALVTLLLLSSSESKRSPQLARLPLELLCFVIAFAAAGRQYAFPRLVENHAVLRGSRLDHRFWPFAGALFAPAEWQQVSRSRSTVVLDKRLLQDTLLLTQGKEYPEGLIFRTLHKLTLQFIWQLVAHKGDGLATLSDTFYDGQLTLSRYGDLQSYIGSFKNLGYPHLLFSTPQFDEKDRENVTELFIQISPDSHLLHSPTLREYVKVALSVLRERGISAAICSADRRLRDGVLIVSLDELENVLAIFNEYQSGNLVCDISPAAIAALRIRSSSDLPQVTASPVGAAAESQASSEPHQYQEMEESVVPDTEEQSQGYRP